jgi:hypothetical protein
MRRLVVFAIKENLLEIIDNFQFQLISEVGSDFSCHSCLDSLDKAHQVKESFLKNQEILVLDQMGKSSEAFTDFRIKEEEPVIVKYEPPKDVFVENYQEEDVEITAKTIKNESTERQ